MNITVDLTKQSFEDCPINFYDSKTIFFDATNILPQTVTFKVWGIGLMHDFDWCTYLDLDKEGKIKDLKQNNPNGEIIVKGFSTLTFQNVRAGKILIFPYDDKQFLKDKNGHQVKFKREWQLDNISPNSFEYWLDTSIYFPYGACDLKLYVDGDVFLEFDTNDCVDYIEYITNPNKQETFWGYLDNKELTTNSYEYKDLNNN